MRFVLCNDMLSTLCASDRAAVKNKEKHFRQSSTQPSGEEEGTEERERKREMCLGDAYVLCTYPRWYYRVTDGALELITCRGERSCIYKENISRSLRWKIRSSKCANRASRLRRQSEVGGERELRGMHAWAPQSQREEENKYAVDTGLQPECKRIWLFRYCVALSFEDRCLGCRRGRTNVWKSNTTKQYN